MQGRTFIRTTLDFFFDNALMKALGAFVNFCNEQRYYDRKKLKFLKKMPLNSIDENKFNSNGYIFNSITANRNGFR